MTSGQYKPGKSFHRVIPSQPSCVDDVCREIRSRLEAEGLKESCFPLELALREALNNAIRHGNGNLPSKSVHLDLSIGRKYIRTTVLDQGRGFNWRKARRSQIPDSDATGGRGLFIIASCSEKLSYSRCGNRLTFWIAKSTGEITPMANTIPAD